MPKSKNGLIGALLVVGLVGGVMIGAYVVNTPDALRVRDSDRRVKPAPSVTSRTNSSPQVFRHKVVGTDVIYEQSPADIPPGADAKVWVVNEFLKSSGIASADARLLGADVRDGIAYLDFNKAFNTTYGSEEESILVNGILATMAQFPDVQKVQFQVEGEPLDTLGHIELTDPQPVVQLDEHNRAKMDPEAGDEPPSTP
jgi:hypothetical protein